MGSAIFRVKCRRYRDAPLVSKGIAVRNVQAKRLIPPSMGAWWGEGGGGFVPGKKGFPDISRF